MATYDIRFVLRTAKDFIRQSGWICNTFIINNDKASITATFDLKCSRWTVAGKLIQDLKILLAYPQFDFTFIVNPGGSILIGIYKRSTPTNIPHHAATDDVKQQALNLKPLNLYRRKNNASDADQP
jgi:hypothetical protein